MKKILNIILVILMLIYLSIDIFAVTYGKTGESTNFNGDVGVPSGSSYFINDVEMVKFNKYDGTVAPDADNDTTEGYKVGSNWYDVTNDKAYICLDNTDGVAVWTETTSQGAGETNTASNIGAQVEIYKQKTGVDLELRTLKADSDKVVVSTTPEGGELDVGTEPYNMGTYISTGYTWINKTNPINQNGTVTSVQIYAVTNYDLTNCEVAIFTDVGGNDYTTRDNETIGTVAAGSVETFDVSLDAEAGDFIGIYFTGGRLETNSTGGSGLWKSLAGGDKIPCTSEEFFEYGAVYDIGVYGTGVTSTLNYIRLNVVPLEIAKEIGGLLSTTTVAFNTDADITLYTVPAGKRCVLSHAIVVVAGDAGATTTVSIGANGAETDFIPANTLSNLDAQYDAAILQPIPNTIPLKIKSYAAATVIEAQVASQSGAAGNTVYLFGILY